MGCAVMLRLQTLPSGPRRVCPPLNLFIFSDISPFHSEDVFSGLLQPMTKVYILKKKKPLKAGILDREEVILKDMRLDIRQKWHVRNLLGHRAGWIQDA